MRKIILTLAVAGLAAFAAEQSSATIEGKAIAVKYTPAPGKISGTFHTDADLVFKGIVVPKGDYTLSVVTEGERWQLVISKAAGGEVGKVFMNMSKATAATPAFKLAVTKTAALAAKLEVSQGNVTAAAPFHLDRVAGDSEW